MRSEGDRENFFSDVCAVAVFRRRRSQAQKEFSRLAGNSAFGVVPSTYAREKVDFGGQFSVRSSSDIPTLPHVDVDKSATFRAFKRRKKIA